MITFYPCKIDLWKQSGMFDFSGDITLITKQKTDYILFRDTSELIIFLKGFGITLTDPKYPLKIMAHAGTGVHPDLGLGVYDIWSDKLLGWIKDDLM